MSLWLSVCVCAQQLEFTLTISLWQQWLLQLPLKSTVLACLPFIIYLMFFANYTALRSFTGLDSIIAPNVHLLPRLERTLCFGYLPHRILSSLANPVLDVLAAIPYLIHFPLPFLYLVFLIFKHQRLVLQYIWLAGWLNLSAVCIQFILPTAPPWFADSAVFDSSNRLISALPNEAAFQRLDAILGVSVFHGIYSHSPVKFGAFPSLHVAWPALIAVFKPPFGNTAAVVHVIWIALAALYSTHHYLVDALGGIFLVCLLKYLVKRTNSFMFSQRTIHRWTDVESV